MNLDRTHDPARRSWVSSANGHSEFPLQNLPYGVFQRGPGVHVGVAIGDMILDLTVLENLGRIKVGDVPVFQAGELNAFMARGPADWHRLRGVLSDLLDVASAPPEEEILFKQTAARMSMPFYVRSFTDFYASRAHATNVGAMFRGAENALMPNWLHLPVGYNGRASGVVVSGTAVQRPTGQVLQQGSTTPVFAPTVRLDMEVELGAVVGTATEGGGTLTPAQADESIFGYVLLNDWSARDLQLWEYQPLGPFLSKAFATTISPWVVTRDALAPFRTPIPPKEHALLPYLASDEPLGFDIAMEASLVPGAGAPLSLCQTNAKHLYYAPGQMLAHLASSGAPICTGDLLGSGTISGPDDSSLGSLLEITENGTQPLRFPDGQERAFLEDGDQISITGRCTGPYSIGFGSCDGVIQAAHLP
ncbi:MAG: fumarylacetoacetase [Dinoroseobacter sp.]|nr:fumarylacetoacetase [Dinoroseobacter sp.]